VALPSVAYDGTSRRFQFACVNGVPRHLGVYAEFLRAGAPLKPDGWKSRLPAGVPAAFETDTLKYLGLLPPNVAVAGLPMPAGPQTVAVELPAAADAVEVRFGGLGVGGWSAVGDAAGVMLTFVLDSALPAVMASAGGDPDAGWYRGVVADASVQAAVIAAGAFLLSLGEGAVLDGVDERLAACLLGDGLAGLRKRIDAKLGVDATANAAPKLGWAAQTLAALHAADPSVVSPPYSRLGSVPATCSLSLSPQLAVTVAATVLPDARTGAWPEGAASYELRAEYAGGFSRRQGGAVPGSAPIAVAFPSVRTGSPIALSATVTGEGGGVLAAGSAVLAAAPVAADGVAKASLAVVEPPVAIGPSTRFVFADSLRFDAGTGTYSWTPGSAPTATKQALSCTPGTGTLCELVDITLLAAARCLGYTWRATDAGVPECGSGDPTTVAYRFQNVGTVDPGAGLQTLACGFAGRPHLAYGASASVFLDPRVPPPSLRPLVPGGAFDLGSALGVGRFAAADLSAVAVHDGGYAVAVSADNSRMEIVALAPAAVADADAPRSRVVAGKGDREGLLDAPVGCAVAPDGSIVVLEAALGRVQAFDVQGNPLPRFGGSALLALQKETGIEYQDIAVSPAGYIYVLSNAGDGRAAADYRLDVYGSDGAFVARTTGVSAARIAVDSAERVYALGYEAMSGAGGRAEPVISRWVPS
jgi:hypothetical protein